MFIFYSEFTKIHFLTDNQKIKKHFTGKLKRLTSL